MMGRDGTPVRGRHDDLTQQIIGVFYDVYNELGPGFAECVYREAMRLAVTQAGLTAATEAPITVRFRETLIGTFRADLIVNGTVLVELKTCEALNREHAAQTLNYLKATAIEVALLMTFGPVARFRRFMMDNTLEQPNSKSVKSVQIGVKPLDDVGVTP